MKHKLSVILSLLLIFITAQIIGLFVVNAYFDPEATAQTGEATFKTLPFGLDRPEVDANTSFIYLGVAIILGTLLLLLIIRFNINILWKLWFFLAVWIALTVSFNAFIPSLAAIILGILFGAWKVFKPQLIVQNLTEIFIYGGLAAIFVPILNIFSSIMLLLLISVYDAYAVWKSGHMIKLAQFQTKSKIFSGLLIPYSLKKVKPTKSVRTKKAKRQTKGVKTAVLGGGDIGFPLLFSGVILTQLGLAKALIITAFASIALFLLLYKGKQDKFYPAMPFITAGCLVGYAIALLI